MDYETELAKFSGLSKKEQQGYYERLTGRSGLHLPQTLLIAFVKSHLQSVIFGDLSQNEKTMLKAIATQTDGKIDFIKSVVIRRSYNGKLYEVEHMPDGRYLYAGEYYKTLSAVASAITGRKHCNGLEFFRSQRNAEIIY